MLDQFSADMGDHAIYVWPSYAAFVLIFLVLIIWVRTVGAREKSRLAKLEADKKA